MIKGKVTGKKIDQNGNILILTEYTLTDGSKKIGHTRYNFLNFSKEKILEDVEAHCKTLMKKVWMLKAHQALIKADVSGIRYQCSQVEIITKPVVRDKLGNIVKPAETMFIDDK